MNPADVADKFRLNLMSSLQTNSLESMTIAVVGLGYVGLPLALAFGRNFDCIGFDINADKIATYITGTDTTREMNPQDFAAAKRLNFTNDPALLRRADIVIVAVPTPIDEAQQPNLSFIIEACRIVGKNLKKGAVVVFESTVFPGVTEEICAPLLSETSGLQQGKDFRLGYSPERFNPGDKEHRLATIVKVVSAEDEDTLELIAQLYERVVDAGVHRAESIRIAEAAKVIENTQRDLNIALMNELAIIFNKLGLDTSKVLEAAATKWNFLPFRPGLVGGHCIGVDPYYLTYKAKLAGHQPEVILAGRRINDVMGKYIAGQTIRRMIEHGNAIRGARCLVMGLAFKENVTDLRNSRVIDLIRELESFGVEVLIWDPLADPADAYREYGLELVELDELSNLDAVVAAVAHDEISDMNLESLAEKKSSNSIPFIDVKSVFDSGRLSSLGFSVWRL